MSNTTIQPLFSSLPYQGSKNLQDVIPGIKTGLGGLCGNAIAYQSLQGHAGGGNVSHIVPGTIDATDLASSVLINILGGLLTDSGTANTYALTPSPAIGAYAAGQVFSFVPTHANTGASTLNVSALGTKAIQKNGNALTGGELTTSSVVIVEYDGTQFQIVSNYVLQDADLPVTTVRHTVVAMSAAQIIAMYATPFQIIAAPGSGKLLVPQAILAVVNFKYGTTPMTGGGDVILQWGNTVHGGGIQLGQTVDVSATVFTGSASACLVVPVATTATFDLHGKINTGIFISNKSAPLAAGDSTTTVDIWTATVAQS